jgi:hypothetical protein
MSVREFQFDPSGKTEIMWRPTVYRSSYAVMRVDYRRVVGGEVFCLWVETGNGEMMRADIVCRSTGEKSPDEAIFIGTIVVHTIDRVIHVFLTDVGIFTGKIEVFPEITTGESADEQEED